MPGPGVKLVGSADAVSVTIPIPKIPQQIAVGAGVLAGLLLLILILKVVGKARAFKKEDEKEARRTRSPRTKLKEPDAHGMVQELQKALISEMKGTSRQNKIMIILTIIFIATSILVTVFSAQINDFFLHFPSRFPQLVAGLKKIFGR